MIDWQPIETAPKDGTRIFAYGEFWRNYAVVFWGQLDQPNVPQGWLFSDDKNDPMWYRSGHYLTHWMPLPEPPK